MVCYWQICWDVGNWQQDQICGQFVYMSLQMRITGQMNLQHRLEGFCTITILSKQSLPPSPNNLWQGPGITLYAMFKNGQIVGRFVAHIQGVVYIGIQNPTPSRTISSVSLDQTLKQTFPYIHTFDLITFLRQLLSSPHPPTPRQLPCTLKFTSQNQPHQFFGFSIKSFFQGNGDKMLGFVLCDDQLYSLGWHFNTAPHTLCTVYNDKGSIHEGLYKNGIMEGQGVRISQCMASGVYRYEISNFMQLASRTMDSIKNNRVEKQGVLGEEALESVWKWVRGMRERWHLRAQGFGFGVAGSGNWAEVVKGVKGVLDAIGSTEDGDYVEMEESVVSTKLANFSTAKKSIPPTPYVSQNPRISSASRIPFPNTPQKPLQPQSQQKRPLNSSKRLSIFSPKVSTTSAKVSITENKEYQSLYSNFLKSIQKPQENPLDSQIKSNRQSLQLQYKSVKKQNLSKDKNLSKEKYFSKDRNYSSKLNQWQSKKQQNLRKSKNDEQQQSKYYCESTVYENYPITNAFHVDNGQYKTRKWKDNMINENEYHKNHKEFDNETNYLSGNRQNRLKFKAPQQFHSQISQERPKTPKQSELPLNFGKRRSSLSPPAPPNPRSQQKPHPPRDPLIDPLRDSLRDPLKTSLKTSPRIPPSNPLKTPPPPQGDNLRGSGLNADFNSLRESRRKGGREEGCGACAKVGNNILANYLGNSSSDKNYQGKYQGQLEQKRQSSQWRKRVDYKTDGEDQQIGMFQNLHKIVKL